MAIREFHGAFRFLSNFYGLGEGHVPLAIFQDGLFFPTVEHAYVAAKTADPSLRPVIQALPTPGQAKRFLQKHGHAKRENWFELKLSVMEDLVRQKFSPLKHPKLSEMLLATGDRVLIEGNTWGDVFWGVDLRNEEGQNHLGRILMKVRAELSLGKG